MQSSAMHGGPVQYVICNMVSDFDGKSIAPSSGDFRR